MNIDDQNPSITRGRKRMLKNKIRSYLDFERDNCLFNAQYKDVYYWNLMRIPLYERVLYTKNKLGGVMPYVPENRKFNFINIFRTLIQFVKHVFSFFKQKKRCDLFFMRTEWNRKIGSSKIDPYFFFIDDIAERYAIHEHSKSVVNRPRHGSNLVSIIAPLALQWLIFKFYTPKIPALSGILGKFNSTFNCKEKYSKWAKYIGFSVFAFKKAKENYHSLLQPGANCVLFKCYYDRLTMALTASARELGIPVVELQHGVMGKYHLAYRMENACFENSYCPDILLTYGTYWTEAAHMPEGTKLITAGSPLMDLGKQIYQTTEPDDCSIIVYSSGPDESELCDLALNLKRVLPQYRVVFKLHPRERHNWRQYYPALAASEEIECIDTDITVYELFSQAKHHVGSASTVLFEALAFSGNIYVLESDFSEYLEDVIVAGDAKLFRTVDQLKEHIENSKPPRGGRSMRYFQPKAKEAILSVLESLLKEGVARHLN